MFNAQWEFRKDCSILQRNKWYATKENISMTALNLLGNDEFKDAIVRALI